MLVISNVVVFVFAMSARAIFATWTPPSNTPPNDNLYPPVYDISSPHGNGVVIGTSTLIMGGLGADFVESVGKIKGASLQLDGGSAGKVLTWSAGGNVVWDDAASGIGTGVANNFPKWNAAGTGLASSLLSSDTMIHVINAAQNPEIKFTKDGADTGEWSIYKDNTNNELRFWSETHGDTIKIGADGKVANVVLNNSSPSTAGAIRWNGTNFQGYNGSAWVNFDTTLACSPSCAAANTNACGQTFSDGCSGSCVGTYCAAGSSCNGSSCISSCVANYGLSCGGTACTNAGTYDCAGTCIGATSKAIGTSCGVTSECNGSGTCVAANCNTGSGFNTQVNAGTNLGGWIISTTLAGTFASNIANLNNALVQCNNYCNAKTGIEKCSLLWNSATHNVICYPYSGGTIAGYAPNGISYLWADDCYQ